MFQAQLSNQSCGVIQCGNNFMVSGDFAVRGNPVSLLDKTLALSSCPNYAFHQLFMANSGLRDAHLMYLPFDEIQNKCFASLFQDCP